MELLATCPEARNYQDLRLRWSDHSHRRRVLERQLAAHLEKERALWAELEAAKAAMPQEGRDLLC
jgi:hypothetical protein